MKKLILIVLAVLMVGSAFAGFNDFKEALGSITPASTDRIHYLDVSAIGNSDKGEGYVTWSWLRGELDEVYGKIVSLDTASVKEADKADDNSTYSISILSTQFLLLDWLFVESGFDASEYIEISNADSNGTALDTLNLLTSGRRTNTYFFNPTQDTTLYIVWKDTCNVDKKVVIRQMVFDK